MAAALASSQRCSTAGQAITGGASVRSAGRASASRDAPQLLSTETVTSPSWPTWTVTAQGRQQTAQSWTNTCSPGSPGSKSAAISPGSPQNGHSTVSSILVPTANFLEPRRMIVDGSMARWFVYILRCGDGSLYTGI